MPIDIDARYRDAVQYIWTGRLKQREKQTEAGKIDAGNRGDVTGGGHMGALELLVKDLLIEFGIDESSIFTKQKLELPGYYRSTKKWDLLVVSRQQLVMAIEFKSIGGSYGNNLNNRTEEALGNAVDVWTAYQEGRFGTGPKPLLGYLFLLRDEPKVLKPVSNKEPHFHVDPAFVGASYAMRAEVLCRRLVLERLYDAACLLLSTNEAATRITEPADDLTFRRFVAVLRGHVVTFLDSQ
ncbi:MAG: PaeR7I family type II restriction endonuclease [Paludisphaera borealis]|uniref:PaeR7I family type II restriction endonuclease n=1 Tax=Paludisphaera borealis TaxID=1387353 RepID=UPI002841C058|nr:PaeR7I family type II restriction endonuclease [Paludisphaera borealis]MDR3618395.1 PaeR7I family type II restriction endonuclease [Paludisphaera borealis]